MKKLFLAAVCILCFVCGKAQTYTSGHLSVYITDSMHHDSEACKTGYYAYYNVTVDSSYVGETVNIVDTTISLLLGTFVNTTGVSPWVFVSGAGGSSFGSGNVPSYPDYSISGGYVHFYTVGVKVTAGADTVHNIQNFDSLHVTGPCVYGTVTGRIYADNNGNCTYDPLETGLIPDMLNLSATLSTPPGFGSSSGWVSSYYGNGTYYMQGQQSWMTSYIVSLPSYYSFIFPSSSCFAGPYSFTTMPQSGVDFPLQCSSSIDVQCYALSPGSIRLHRAFYMEPYVSNTGCDMASGQLTLVKDSRVIYDASLSSTPADIVHGDTLIWNYAGLNSFAGTGYWNSFMSNIHLEPDATVAVGDTLCFRVYTNIPAADINAANNDYTVCLPVVYSFDPNVKEVSPKGDGPAGYISPFHDTLTYTLHFQNTGSAAAENISVIDTLDSHLNPASLKILGASHNMSPKWLAANVVQFNFNYINLPDSFSNEPASHGAVRFSIALNNGLAAGTPIKNTGYIYFDLNPPVVTNTVLNTIAIPTNIANVNAGTAVVVYPNPATDHITVEHLKGGELSIINVSGSVMLRQNVTDNKATIDVSRLPGGVYLLKTVNGSGTSTTRFTKY